MTANYNNNDSLSTIELLSIDSKQFLPVSLFKGCRGDTKRLKSTQLGKLIESITDPDKKEFIALSKELARFKREDPGKYKELKETECPAFIPGDFDNRTNKGCKKYAPLIGFDIDAVKDEVSLMFTLEACKKLPYVCFAFPSPSNEGLRILIWTDSTPEYHKEYYKVITEKLSIDLGIYTDKELRQHWKKEGLANDQINTQLGQTEHIDTSTNNISRIWFFTHVPKDMLYVNWESDVFKLEPEKHTVKAKVKTTTQHARVILTDDVKIKLCIDKVARQNIAGGRNNLVFALACEFCRFGIKKDRALSECLAYEQTDFAESEIIKTVKSAYNLKRREFSDSQIMSYLKNPKNQELRDLHQEAPGGKQSTKQGEKPNQVPSDDSNKPKFIRIKNFISRRYDLRLNLVSLDIEFSEKGKSIYKLLNENDLICELLEAGFVGVESPLIALLKSSFATEYDPFFHYFENLPEWKESDPDYIEGLANYIDAKDQDWFNSQFKKMLVRMVACALNKIAFNKQCFVLKGGQNDGKSSFVRFLCPPKLKNYITDHIDVNNKDGRLALCQNFIINLDELSQFPRADIRKVKSLITLDKVKERLPYDRKPTTVLRRASFLGSTNDDEFLVDETGNVRWLIMEINRHGVNHDKGGANGYMAINIDLVYSQAYALLKNGFPFELTKEELRISEKNNKNYKVVTVEQELIQDFFMKAKEGEPNAIFLTATNILQKIQLEVTKTTIHKTNIGKALSALGFEKSQKWYPELGYNKKGYWVKELNND